MSSIFSLKVLPAADGDCLILSWGTDDEVHHLVVDGGRKSTYPHLRAELTEIAERNQSLELFVLTHVDADHIEGALAFAADRAKPVEPLHVWFNGHKQLRQPGRRSIRQGDDYTKAIEKLDWSLNHHFVNGIASVEGAISPIDVAGLKITMLSPNAERLSALAKIWDKWIKEQSEDVRRRNSEENTRSERRERNPIPQPLVLEDLVADSATDTEAPNGSSIAFIAEWVGRRILFAGDAHPDLLAASLAPLAASEGGRYRIDFLKASHHGSAKNTTRELMELIDCPTAIISTNGNSHGHPDPQAIARFVKFAGPRPKIVHFNYATDRTLPWDCEITRDRNQYKVVYPSGSSEILEIDLLI